MTKADSGSGNPRNLWDEIIALRDDQREDRKGAIQIVKRASLPPEKNDLGLMRWYMHPSLPKLALSTLLFYELEIPPGSRSGRLKFQGGQVLFVVEGKGYTVIDGVKHHWEAGDVLNLPLRRHGIIIQHFNADGENRARLVATEPNLLNCTTVDRGSGFELLEKAPDEN